MTGDVRRRALGEIEAAKRDVYARRLLAGDHRYHGVDDPRLETYEEWRLVAEGWGHPARGDTPGHRFVASASWEAYRGEGLGYSTEQVSVPVLAADELHGYFLAATLLEAPWLREVRSEQVAVVPLPDEVAGLVNVVPITGREARRIELGVTEPTGGGLIPGAASPEIVLTAASTDVLDTFRWAVHANIDRYSLVTDDAFAARVIDALVGKVLRRQLAFEIIMGAGTTVGDRRQLLGLNSAPGVNVQALSVSRVETLIKAIEQVQLDGCAGPHQLVAHPTDLAEMLNEATWRRDRFPTLERIVPFDKLTAGTGFVGQFSEADLYIRQGVSIDVSQEHVSNFTAGVATVQASMFTTLDIQAPDGKSAFTKMTGI